MPARAVGALGGTVAGREVEGGEVMTGGGGQVAPVVLMFMVWVVVMWNRRERERKGEHVEAPLDALIRRLRERRTPPKDPNEDTSVPPPGFEG